MKKMLILFSLVLFITALYAINVNLVTKNMETKTSVNLPTHVLASGEEDFEIDWEMEEVCTYPAPEMEPLPISDQPSDLNSPDQMLNPADIQEI